MDACKVNLQRTPGEFVCVCRPKHIKSYRSEVKVVLGKSGIC